MLVLIGCGAVGTAFLELMPICGLIRQDSLARDDARIGGRVGASTDKRGREDSTWCDVIIIEPRTLAHVPADVLRHYHYRHVQTALTADNIYSVLERELRRGDVVVDASVNVDALAVMRVCWRTGCMYMNTSMEDWMYPHPERIDASPRALYDRSLYSRIVCARAEFAGAGPSMVADIGMNPGLISSFAFQALSDLARATGNTAACEAALHDDMAACARALDVAVIHVTELDTQRTREARPADTFWNTWSSVGLIAESLDPVQIGFGTGDESKLPALAVTPDVGPANVRIVPVRGMDMRLWSVSPNRDDAGFRRYEGFSIPHGEANTISHALTVNSADVNGIVRAEYRPSVFFVYQPCPAGRESLDEMRAHGYRPTATTHVMALPELLDGYDAIGALVITRTGSHEHPQTHAPPPRAPVHAWWAGTVADVRDMTPIGIVHSGPTVIQVAAALLAALKCILADSARGFMTPEQLPWRQMVADTRRFLGRTMSCAVAYEMPERVEFDSFKV